MKLIIAGSRTFDATLISTTMDLHFLLRLHGLSWPTELVNGGCPTGADLYCSRVADYYEISCKVFPANFKELGKKAGPIRNREMAEYADALLLIWDGESRGSKNMKDNMIKLNKPVYEVIFKKTTQEL